MISRRNEGGQGAVTRGVASFKANLKLNDDRVLDVVAEDWWGGPTVVMTTIFPSVIIQQQVNSLSTRHIQPRGADTFDFVWTHFGFADDTADMRRRRLRQANLFGPAGYVSADDGEVIEFSQQGARQRPERASVIELGGTDTAARTEHTVTETLIRSMYGYWRRVMDV
jgi:salicylate 5-hydroxylase large subunit